MAKITKISSSVTDKLLDIYYRFEPSFIQKSTGIPASVYSRFRQGTFKPSQKTIGLLVREGRKADQKELYNLAKKAGYSIQESKKIRTKSRYEALSIINKTERPVKPFKKLSEVLPSSKISTTVKPLKTLPQTVRIIERAIRATPAGDREEKRRYIYDLARKTGLTSTEARDVRGWNTDKAEKYILMREGGAMVQHAKAAAEGSLSFVENQNARYNRVADFLAKKHNVPVEYIKRGMTINYSKERTVDDWEEYIKEKHGIKF